MIHASAAPRIETWVSAMMLSLRETEAMLTDSDLLMGGEDELEGGEQKGPELLSPDSD